MRLLIGVFAVLCLVSISAQSQPPGELSGSDGVWSEFASPIGRRGHTSIYDPVRDRMVVFGGDIECSYRNDVWALSLGESPEWTELTPLGTPPSARCFHTAIYDPVRDRMVVFAGDQLSAYYYPGEGNDVWALSLGPNPEWTALTPLGTPPSRREGHTAIYDPVRDGMLVFGGLSGARLNDVWELSLGSNPEWTALTPLGTPPDARSWHTAICDPVRHQMVVFGGGAKCVSSKRCVGTLARGNSAVVGTYPVGDTAE